VIAYLIRRVAQALVVVFGVTLLIFLLEHLVPGGEARAALGQRATAVQIEKFNHDNGYDLSLVHQYWNYCRDLVLHFNLGYSYKQNQTVQAVIWEKLPKTLVLVGLSTLLAALVAIPLGVLQVVRRNKPIDYVVTGGAFIGYAMPPFLLGQLLIIFFAIDLKWFGVEAPQSSSVAGILSDPRDLVLPVFTLSAITIASFSRYMRSSLMDAITQDYIRTARAKGASSGRVLYRHALPNALIPLITLLGLSLPGIVGGALITETVFNFPGMGLLTTNAAINNDVPLLLGTTFVGALATVLGSLVADVLYAVVDPRVRYA
jgi:peptide/nickel transport system permease protein